MMNIFEKELLLVRRDEQRFLKKKSLFAGLDKLREKIPDGLERTLNRAFRMALGYFMGDGAALLDRMIAGEEILSEYREREEQILRDRNFEALRQLDKTAARSRGGNLVVTAVEGTGLGLLGVGLPDIPVFLGMILKTARETALRYGFTGRSVFEESYFLRVLCGGILGGEEGKALFAEADKMADGLDLLSSDP
ncbi:MAG: EcsC family protein, partial [Oscillospiraceae bacterium]|nr:EcsC family protein [Oscillospiraceae bacterium]